MAAAHATIRAIIRNERGLHARAAAKFVKLAATFDAEVTVMANGTEVPGSSIMGLMMLAAATGCELVLEATGPQSRPAVRALAKLIENSFDED